MCEWMANVIMGHIREEKREVTGGKRTAGGKQREGDSDREELHWSRPRSRREPGQAGKAAPDSRKGRKMGFPSEPPDSTHSQLKQEEENRETIYLLPRKTEAPSPGAPECASSQSW